MSNDCKIKINFTKQKILMDDKIIDVRWPTRKRNNNIEYMTRLMENALSDTDIKNIQLRVETWHNNSKQLIEMILYILHKYGIEDIKFCCWNMKSYNVMRNVVNSYRKFKKIHIVLDILQYRGGLSKLLKNQQNLEDKLISIFRRFHVNLLEELADIDNLCVIVGRCDLNTIEGNPGIEEAFQKLKAHKLLIIDSGISVPSVLLGLRMNKTIDRVGLRMTMSEINDENILSTVITNSNFERIKLYAYEREAIKDSIVIEKIHPDIIDMMKSIKHTEIYIGETRINC